MGWAGGFCYLALEIPVGDVVSISKIDDIAAAHDKQHKQPRDGCFESTPMIGMACRVDRKRIPGVRALTLTPSWGPEISSDGFVFIFFCCRCVVGLSPCCVFGFLFSDRRVV